MVREVHTASAVKRFVAALLALVGFPVFLSSCGESASRAPRRNIVLLVLDTVRADHLGVYGSPRNATPFLDSLARQGVLFDGIISPSATTSPSIGSLLTGVLPFEHGVRALESLHRSRLRPEFPTVAEILRERGFSTAAFVSSVTASSRYGFDRGFDLYRDVETDAKLGQISASEVNSMLLSWLRNRAAGESFFTLAHYFDVHDISMRAPEPYLSRFPQPRAKGREKRIARYDGELLYLDHQLREVLRALDETGLLESTLVIVVADHGEGLGDHGFMGHGILYQEQIRVPLLILGPGLPAGRRVPERLSALNVAPTILDLAGVPSAVWPAHYRGASLRPWLEGVGGPPDPWVFAEAHTGKKRGRRHQAEIYAALAGPWKYLYYPLTARGELFHLASDPGEGFDRARDEETAVEELHEALETLGIMIPLEAQEEDGGELSEARREALRALGYVD